jgi:uncharacterized protein YjeT (DUF2065 family)
MALAVMLVLEGLLPLVSPAAWRNMFAQLLSLRDGQIRFFGLGSILMGLLAIWWLMP